VPLYVGRMIHQYDHRHASVTVNDENLHNAAFGAVLDSRGKADPGSYPTPQYWVMRESIPANVRLDWALGFRDIARATDVRLANLNSLVFDFVARQKVQSTSFNLFILEQLPVIAPERFEASIGGVKIADFVRAQVLHLSYTAHDLAAFARDLGHVDAQGQVLPPFVWNDEDRRARLAALDGLFFHLYGLGEDDAAYILDTFPIVRQQDEAAFGRFCTRDDVLAQLRHIERGVLAVNAVTRATGVL
jgi:hypothetical protein